MSITRQRSDSALVRTEPLSVRPWVGSQPLVVSMLVFRTSSLAVASPWAAQVSRPPSQR
jgi:hypothetical protein